MLQKRRKRDILTDQIGIISGLIFVLVLFSVISTQNGTEPEIAMNDEIIETTCAPALGSNAPAQYPPGKVTGGHNKSTKNH